MSYEQLCIYADVQTGIIMRLKEENARLREALAIAEEGLDAASRIVEALDRPEGS